MAKSARSSDRKRNNANLRARVFGPAHDARTARLSAKLQELASKPKPDQEKVMDIDTEAASGEAEDPSAADIADIEMSGAPASRPKVTRPGKSHKIEKREARRKPRNKMVFPTSAAKRKRIAQSKKKAV